MRSAQQWSGLPSVLTSSRFEEENQRLLELNQRCQFASYATMQWLDIRLQLMGAAVVSAIAVIALVQHQQGLANPGTTMGPIPLTLGAGHSRSLTQAHPHVSLPHPAPLSSPTQCYHHPHFSAEESMGRGGSGTRPRLLRSSFPCSCLPHYSIPLRLRPATPHSLLLRVFSNPSLSSACFSARSCHLQSNAGVLALHTPPTHFSVSRCPPADGIPLPRAGGPRAVVCLVLDGPALGPGEQLHTDRRHDGERGATGGVLLWRSPGAPRSATAGKSAPPPRPLDWTAAILHCTLLPMSILPSAPYFLFAITPAIFIRLPPPSSHSVLATVLPSLLIHRHPTRASGG